MFKEKQKQLMDQDDQNQFSLSLQEEISFR